MLIGEREAYFRGDILEKSLVREVNFREGLIKERAY